MCVLFKFASVPKKSQRGEERAAAHKGFELRRGCAVLRQVAALAVEVCRRLLEDVSVVKQHMREREKS